MQKVFLFDIDGTLTEPRQQMTEEMENFLIKLKNKNVVVAIVGGSDVNKAIEQIGPKIFELFEYVFSENGLVFYKKGTLVHKKSLRSYYTQQQLNEFINHTLRLIADTDVPIKTGTFIEYRNGMINVSPIGRACSKEERDEFEKLDNVHKYRQTMINTLKNKFKDMKLRFSIGGQISFDVFPEGTDKSFCLQYLMQNIGHECEIHFFGDKTTEGGNDYEIYVDSRVNGHTVINYHDTINICKQLMNMRDE